MGVGFAMDAVVATAAIITTLTAITSAVTTLEAETVPIPASAAVAASDTGTIVIANAVLP